MPSIIMDSHLPNITNDTHENDVLTFDLMNSADELVRDLRIYLMSKLPTMALDTINIVTNESVLHDEFLAMRIGQIPLRSTRASEFKDKCNCGNYCDECGIRFHLQIDRYDDIYQVTNDDLINPFAGEHSIINKAASVIPMKYVVDGRNSPIPIIGLINNQKLDIECIARKGTGSQHAKWTPVCRVTAIRLGNDVNNTFRFTIETNGQYTTQELLDHCRQFVASN